MHADNVMEGFADADFGEVAQQVFNDFMMLVPVGSDRGSPLCLAWVIGHSSLGTLAGRVVTLCVCKHHSRINATCKLHVIGFVLEGGCNIILANPV